ncbi:MAG: hypothetical protein AAB568_01195 [Patescibacteria group bacterium]
MYYSNFKPLTTIDRLFDGLEHYRVALVVCCLVFGLAYFWQVNSVSTRGFKIRELQTGIDILKESNHKLELQAATAQSWQNIQEKIKQLNMVESGQVEYLRPAGSDVAIK